MTLERITEALALCQKGLLDKDLGAEVKLSGKQYSETHRYCKFPEFGCKHLIYPAIHAESGKKYYLCKRDITCKQ
jgi:hypothetical protein